MEDEDTYGSVRRLSTEEWGAHLTGFRSSPPDEPVLLDPSKVEISRKLGDYLVLQVHYGGMSEVFVCLRDQDSLQSPIALKSFSPRFQFDRSARRAFQRECALWVRASIAPGVFPIYGLINIDGRTFIGMPGVLPGPHGEICLRDLLLQGPLPLDQAISFARTLAFSMSCAGVAVPGLVHGDLKPANVLLWHDRPYVSDFGLARRVGQLMLGDALLGSRKYCSPLARNPVAQLTVLDDIYSFGVMLEEMVTGRLPGQHGDSRKGHDRLASDNASMELITLAQLCRAENPDKRPRDFSAVFDKLDTISGGGNRPRREESEQTSDVAAMTRRLDEVAITLVQLKDYSGALETTDNIHRFRRSYAAWISRGVALSELGNPGAALRCYRRALSTRGDQERAVFREDADWLLFFAAGAFVRMGRPRRAATIMRRLTKSSNENLAAHATYSLGSAYIEMRRFREAHWLFQQMEEGDRGTDYWNQMGVIYLRLQEHERAAEAYRRAIELEPSNAQFYSGLGQALISIPERISDALDAFNCAIGCGSMERLVFVCALCCSILLADPQELLRLLSVTSGIFGKAETFKIHRQASRLAQAVVIRAVPHYRQAWRDKRWARRRSSSA
jgi:serine/threonine protein kinase